MSETQKSNTASPSSNEITTTNTSEPASSSTDVSKTLEVEIKVIPISVLAKWTSTCWSKATN